MVAAAAALSLYAGTGVTAAQALPAEAHALPCPGPPGGMQHSPPAYYLSLYTDIFPRQDGPAGRAGGP